MNAKAFAVILKPLLELHGYPKNWEAKLPIYYEALADIPEALLDRAVKHQIASNAFFPKPADLRACIADELAMFRRKRDEARFAALPKPPDPSPPSPEDMAHVTEQMSKIREVLRTRAMVMAPHSQFASYPGELS